MKNILKYISLLTLTLLLTTSCEDFLDVNTDPNNPTSVTPDLVLPVAQKYTGEIIQWDRYVSHLGNMMMYNWSQSDGFSWYNDEFLYQVSSSFYQQIFNVSYRNALKQYQILDNLVGDEYANYRAISKVMKAYHFQLLVDFYGDIPYTEALQRSQEATPVYDDAATIYADLIVELDSAITLIKNADPAALVPDEYGDIIFEGEMTDWIRMANSVKLRILVRNSDVDDVSDEIAAIEAEGTGFITSDVLVNPGYLKEEEKQNPLWDDLGWDVGGTQTLSSKATCATPYVLEWLFTRNDPRIDYIYENPENTDDPNNFGGHVGVIQGLDQYDSPVVDAYVPEKVSNIGPGILKGATMGANILSLAEVYFNRAEAAFKGLLPPGDAKTYYEAGIAASFDYLGVGGAAAYYGQAVPLVGWNSSTNQELEAIITQKWIAMNGITAEQSWFDYSRTGFPSGLPISELASTSDRPVRLFYPAGEISSNGENVPTQPDAFTDKIFWAGN
ncbi:MAG: SusD/RagB family nutrient-binding outer membrane lipoprotein [Bacteroidales bacterium]|nr:SusD/RagB family nutrient-binding outer membrane lipoprotein [Bacteroidales bacterium]